MPRVLEDIPAVVLAPGPDLPGKGLETFRDCFTIGVNRLWKAASGFVPTSAFWIDGGVYGEWPGWFDRLLCVCDRSSSARPEHIGLPMRGGAMPREAGGLDPRVLHHRPNTGVVAALWAVSLGCRPVVLLGMGCEPDGRAPAQLAAMRAALDEAIGMEYRTPGDWRNVLWPWARDAVEDPAVWASRVHSPRLRACDASDVARRLREFYGAAHPPR